MATNLERTGAMIKDLREARGWTQGEFADQLRQAGYDVGQRAISKWERGQSKPTIHGLAIVEQVLQVEEGDLFDRYYPNVFAPKVIRPDEHEDKPLLAGHGGLDDLTDEEIDEVIRYAEYLRSRRDS